MRQASSRDTALRTPSRHNSDTLLLASKMFDLYDELICDSDDEEWANISSGTSWLDHSLGQLGLILQRPPDQYVDGVAHCLFVEGQMATSMMSIVHRKRTALSTAEWTRIPWTKIQKTSRDKMFDIMSDISGILEDFDSVRALEDPVKREEQYLLFVEECWRTDHKLTWWFHSMSPSKDIGDLIHRNFPDPTGCRSTADSAAEVLLRLPKRADPRTYCKNMIDATEVLHHPVASAFGTHAQLFSLIMAAAYLLAMENGADVVEQMAALAGAWFGMETEQSLEAVVSSFCIPTAEWNCA
ncbi:hypothetical protein NM208_g11737 [Fusarium decemcellulare]|uniref:Uncharacterized protein n=1 Tax=Fusarium decemcellulare TaxID=57161 RepID=A0ACC1RTW0_9HYPO|nr:hypothetical protein NM208_g11737 [Fusarium decemcellulare]